LVMQPGARVVVDVVVGVSSDSAVAGGDPAAQERIAELADGLERLTHIFNRARARLLNKPHGELEWSALLLAKVLVIQGPLRAGMLAELVQSDPSTVSRQVAQLVADGFVERKTDPVDGRASMLVATAKAHRVVDEHRKIRDAHYSGILEDWSEQDRDQFAALLARFVADFEAYGGRPVTSNEVTSSSEWLATAGQGRNGDGHHRH
jgi:DNA-binding MarR family transcriptional regulator